MKVRMRWDNFLNLLVRIMTTETERNRLEIYRKEYHRFNEGYIDVLEEKIPLLDKIISASTRVSDLELKKIEQLAKSAEWYLKMRKDISSERQSYHSVILSAALIRLSALIFIIAIIQIPF